MIIRILLSLILSISLLSCVHPQIKEQDSSVEELIHVDPIPEKLDKEVVEQILEISDSLIEFINGENLLELKFKTFEMSIDSIDIWNDEVDLKEHNSDTVIVYLDLGSSIEEKKIRIKQLLEGRLRVFQSYENSITIMNEGPHCDMNDWKHYNSDWAEIEFFNDTIETNSYSEEEWNKFIDVDMSEFIDAVRLHCGERWANLAEGAKSPTDYPSGVSMSRIYLKVEYSNDKTGMVSTKIIAFEIPMGC